MEKPEKRVKAAAPTKGLMPNHAPRPTPPKPAWAMPPPAITKRRVTTYVPITAQSIAARNPPKRACWKNV